MEQEGAAMRHPCMAQRFSNTGGALRVRVADVARIAQRGRIEYWLAPTEEHEPVLLGGAATAA